MSNIAISERINWIGSSETPALLGVSPYLSRFELWHQKAGNLAPDNLDDNERVMAGQFLEPAIAAWATHKWDWLISSVEDYTPHRVIPKLGASLDFQTITSEPVEIKNVDFLIFRDDFVAEGEVIIDAPLKHLVQIQTQLACRPQCERGWLVVCVGGNSLYRMEVKRHPATIARIEAETVAFWASIDAGIEPRVDWTADADAVIAMCSIAGEEAVDFTDNNHLPELCGDYRAAGEAEKAAGKCKRAAKAEILHIIGVAGKALVGENYTVSAGMVAEAEIAATTRKEYRRFSISKKADKTAIAEGIAV